MMKTRFCNELPNLTLIICYWKWITCWTLPIVWWTVWQIQPDRGIGDQTNWGKSTVQEKTQCSVTSIDVHSVPNSCFFDLKSVQIFPNAILTLLWWCFDIFMIYVALIVIITIPLYPIFTLWILTCSDILPKILLRNIDTTSAFSSQNIV